MASVFERSSSSAKRVLSSKMRFTSFVSLAVLCSIAAAVPTAPAPKDCSAEVAKYNMERRAARGLSKRTFYSQMLDLTCALSPEATLEDYTANPPIRTDITEGQPGVAFTLDIGVMNTSTCKPLPNAMVELWGPNAVGAYGTTFLRGATKTASNGIAEFQTIFPGFTSEGANHLNILVHPTASESSGVAHVGQLFFTDPWTDVVSQYTDYNKNTNHRMKNSADPVFAAANSGGVNSIVDLESINDDWPEGIIGYITVGVNPTKLVA
ncbi:Intradiol ring-cleavage dioxygenase [Mycena belliarum]|uniref:Intradiol ring-cleavage dioxygenase n=1 Tax=Mycena belliarum TaxID=1033014 RepID=A0AAD6TUL2_9AGAR|nr:Intradiol ring-cleavage dioxygenase [Mycena belliae]